MLCIEVVDFARGSVVLVQVVQHRADRPRKDQTFK